MWQEREFGYVPGRLGALDSPSLTLQELTNSCGTNQVQDFFQVANNGTASTTVSDISIKLWVDDTSAAAIVAQIDTGGCLLTPAGAFTR